ncbi:amino acid adenylation domain-containing protein [Kribbella sp. NPDC056861]|uniref:amino acid adenylation domain-containing protein n=1 Tax=Kribbella sp. NPDC056861 TaxID=3154857 RepID=UPI00341E3AEA
MLPTAAVHDVLREQARRTPDRLAVSFLADGETESGRFSYAQLAERADSIAAALMDKGVRGEPVLLLYPPGLDYVAGFFGCLAAGAIAVPLYPPTPGRVARTLPRLAAVVADSRARLALTTIEVDRLLTEHTQGSAELSGLKFLRTDLPLEPAGAGRRSGLGPASEIAYLQYTSGSTGDPKGVMVGHGNLIDNCAAMARAWQLGPDSRMVSWLPLFHDMGLIAGLLLPIHSGFPLQLMPPAAFVQKPVRWLRAIDEFGATFSGAPNFAYDLCVDKVTEADRETLDLSGWETAFNAAEPVHAATLRRFTAAFSWSGFRREALSPSYGLAEATLIVTAGRPGTRTTTLQVDADALAAGRLLPANGSGARRELVSCGQPIDSGEVAIVDPETRAEVPDGELGEVWVRGATVTGGYRDRLDATAEVFGAVTTSGADGYLRTGDLGFRHEGELYLASRLKDLIIVRGRNYHPQDLEHASERSHPLVRPGGAAAFSAEQDDRVVVLQEVRRPGTPAEYAEVLRAIRLAVTDHCDLQPDEIALVTKGQLLKTSSGKIQRRLCRSRYDEGALDVVAVDTVSPALVVPEAEAGAEAESVGAWLAREWPSLAAEPRVPFVALGLDSLRAMQLSHALHQNFGLVVDHSVLLDRCTAADLTAVTVKSSLEPRPVEADASELSAGQRSLWFLHQLAPDSPAYNQIFAATVHRRLDPAALQQALDALTDRHAVLRTTYDVHDGVPFARIAERGAALVTRTDAAEWTDDQVRERLDEVVHTPFDLADGPMLRVEVIDRRPGESLLILCVHHIALDFWSLGLLIEELTTRYGDVVRGEALQIPAPPPRPVQLQPGRTEIAWQYWSQVLAGDPPALDLPVARRRPPVFSNRGSACSVPIDAELTARLRAFARDENVTLYTLLLTAFQVLLHRYSGQDDFVVGTPSSGRTDATVAETLGYFVNMVPLRARFGAATTFRAALAATRESVLGALAHQELPLSELVDRLGAHRDASRAPLFDVAFLVQQPHRDDLGQLARFALGTDGGRLRLGELELSSLEVEQRLARFDLELWMVPEGDQLLGSLRYCTDLFSAATATQLLEHYAVLLERLLDEPDQPVDAVPLLTEEQHAVMVQNWNATSTPYPSDVCLHELFEASVDRAPDAVAVAGPGGTLTYAEVEDLANRIAHRLLDRGVEPGDKVGLVLDRTLAMVPALLGVLKAGAAYVPVEPDHPTARTAATYERLDVRTVLTDSHHVDRVAALPSVREVIAVDRPLDGPAGRPGRRSAPGDLAYVILTSGSTGEPKGVAVAHRPVVNTIDWVNRRYGVGPHDRVLFVTSLCFDLSVYDVFGLLAAGGSIRVASTAETTDPQALLEVLRTDGITFWDSAPAALNQLAGFFDGSAPSKDLRLVFLSGDWIPVTLPAAVTSVFPNALVVGLGGATEAAIWSNFHEIVAVEPDWSSIPYGRPIQNARYYILDDAGHPVPVGVPGQLHIGGECLALGYAGDPELTADRFVPDPFRTEPGARMYRTGDRVRFGPDGRMEFLGRMDSMVKVRGFRIEPGEIETLLARLPELRQAAVIPFGERADQRLVAYVTPRQQPDSGESTDTWARIFDDVYGDQPAADPAFNLAGWIDGHTGLPFPAAEMREWVETTVARLQDLAGPSARVLEIGCGTGLLLSALAASSTQYVGTDISAAALGLIRDNLLPSAPELTGKVELLELAADGLAELAGRRFDLIVLNSVAQYFPDADYLVEVLRNAAALLAPGGALFVGDVRNLATEKELRDSVQRSRGTPAAEIATRAAAESARERELLVHPDLFTELAAIEPALTAAQILLKAGHHRNELNTFRYDVVLHSASDATATTPTSVDWTWDGESVDALADRLGRSPSAVRVAEIADARFTTPDETASAVALDPAHVWELSGRWSDREVAVTWPRSGRTGRFDLLVSAPGATLPQSDSNSVAGPDERRTDWSVFTNSPAHGEPAAGLIARLRHELRQVVPDYMVPSAFVVLPDGLPVTANGKLDRAALPEPADVRAGVAAEFVAPDDAVQTALAEIWCEVLGADQVGIHDRFFELGGDSILSIQVVSRAAARGLALVPRDLFRFQTVAELADAVRAKTAGDGVTTDDEVLRDEPDDDTDLMLLPAQDWFFDQRLDRPGHFNQSFLFEVQGRPVDPAEAEQAVQAAFGQHEALRLTFTSDDGGWKQQLGENTVVVTRVVSDGDCTDLADRENELLDLTAGPLARVVLLCRPDGSGCDRILLVIHHLVVDGVSWWVLLDDLSAQLDNPAASRATAGTSYRRWSRALQRHGRELADQVPVWQRLLGAGGDPILDRRTGREDEGRTVGRNLTTAETDDLLLRANTAYRTHTDELLLAAFAIAVREWAGSTRIRLDLEGHGRDVLPEVDVTRTVGWFTTFTPLLLDLTGTADDQQVLTTVKEQRRAVPGGPADFGLLSRRPEGAPLRDLAAADVGFNYLGRLDQLGGDRFRLLPGRGGRWRAPSNRRPYPLEVNCQVLGGRFEFTLTGDSDELDVLADGFAGALRRVIAGCLAPDAGRPTPSDFPMADLDATSLAAVLAQFGRPTQQEDESR